MRKLTVLAVVGGALLTSTVTEAQSGGRSREGLRERLAERASAAERRAPQVTAGQTIAYGDDPAQRLDFWPAQGASAPAPLIIFVHGGGWQRGSKDNATGRWKANHYPGQGYAFASIDYRLVPAATAEQQAADIASAVKALIDRAGALGLDRRRIVLMGHSAGAQLVALVGTDERYLQAAGLSFADLAGVIAIDGAAYDVPAQMRDGPELMQKTYAQAFGADPARQRLLSPTLQSSAPNAARFLLLHVQREDGVRQTQALAAALKAGGSAVDVASVPGQGLMGHMEINRSLGDPGYAATATVDAWLKRVFAG
ncbi:MAG: alpha/beta hydrolase [Novosphingobium sp.]